MILVLTAVDYNNTVILLLLNLSAAFDTVHVDHSILLSRLTSHFGIKGTILAWLRSYLTSRKHFVNVNKCIYFLTLTIRLAGVDGPW